jgi:hypothetical protein
MGSRDFAREQQILRRSAGELGTEFQWLNYASLHVRLSKSGTREAF